MKILVDIDDRLFNEVKALTRAKKKKDAIVIPMREYLLARKREDLAGLIGHFDLGMNLKDLRNSRKKWKKS